MKSGTAPLKRYYSNIPGSRFPFSDGTEAHFNYGFYDTDSLQEQEELNAILGKNPNIYNEQVLKVAIPPVVQQNAASEIAINMEDARMRNLRGRETGEINAGGVNAVVPPELTSPGQFPNGAGINAHDPQLQAAMTRQAATTTNASIAPPAQSVGETGVAPVNPITGSVEEPIPPVVGPGAVNDPMAVLQARLAASQVSTSK